MDARYVQRGDAIDHTPMADVAAGEVVVLGSLVGVAKLDIKAGEFGSLALTGVFEMKKLPNYGFIGCGKVGWSVERKGVGGSTTPDAVPLGHNIKRSVPVGDETMPVRLCQGVRFS